MRLTAARTIGFVVTTGLAGSAAGVEPLLRLRTPIDGIDYRNVCGDDEQLPILEQNGQGVAVIDYDGDGWMDLFVPNGSTHKLWRDGRNPGSRLYRNLGDWRFADVTERAGVRGNAWANGAAVADYDADGDYDLYVTNWGANTLYRNDGDGTFTDVTERAGVGDPRWNSSAAFADFDGDGRLDLYVSNYVEFDFDHVPSTEKDGKPCLYKGVPTGCGPWCYRGQRDTLYLQRDAGRFEDVTVAANLDVTDGFRGFGVVAADFDDDGDADVFVGCDVMPNLYLENLGIFGDSSVPRFASVGPTSGGAYNANGGYESSMGVVAADFDRSGSLDLVVTNFADEKNTYYRNDRGMFSDDSTTIRLDRHRSEMGWGVCLADFNQDSRVDVFIVNGHIYPQVDQRRSGPQTRPSATLDDREPSHDPRASAATQDSGLRTQDSADQYAQLPRYYEQSPAGYLDEPPRERIFDSSQRFCLRGCTAVDLDNDGDLDIVAVEHRGSLVFFENTSNRPALILDLVDARGGRSPMGARVSVGERASRLPAPDEAPDQPGASRTELTSSEIVHILLPNQGYQSSQDPRVFIPLTAGVNTGSVLSIRWPDGATQHVEIPSPPRQLTIRQRAGQ